MWHGTKCGCGAIRPGAWVAGLAVAALLVPAGPVRAQTALAPITLQMPGSTRALGMGNAYPFASVESDVLFYNPAFIVNARGLSGSVSMQGSASLLFTVSGAAEWWNGGVGFGMQSLTYSAAGDAAGAYVRGEAGLSESGELAASEQVATASYARRLFGLRVGIAGKLFDYRVGGFRETTVAGDLGVAKDLGDVVVGLAGRNLGRDPGTDTFGTDLPAELTLGAGSSAFQAGPLDVRLAASGSWRRDHTLAAGGGVEASYWPVQGRTFTGRIGIRWIEDSDLQPLTLGAGFTGDRLSIDWAFEGVDAGDATHRFTIRLR